MKGVNIFLADGFEDVEALGTYDVLTRGGIKVNLVAIGDEPFVTSSHGVTVGIENFLHEMELSAKGTDSHDVMIFPGGMPGTKNLAACKPLIKAMKEHYAAGGRVAAICAAPGFVLGQLGPEVLTGVKFTGFEGCETLAVENGGVYTREPAVTDGRIITGRSAAYALDFGMAILSAIADEDAVAKVRYGMYLK